MIRWSTILGVLALVLVGSIAVIEAQGHSTDFGFVMWAEAAGVEYEIVDGTGVLNVEAIFPACYDPASVRVHTDRVGDEINVALSAIKRTIGERSCDPYTTSIVLPGEFDQEAAQYVVRFYGTEVQRH